MEGPGAVEALQELARREVRVHPGLRHLELFTLGGLLTVMWHEPPPGVATRAAVVACGGAMGGLLGPGDALYHRLGEQLAIDGVATLRVGYRTPNDLDRCTHDVAAGVELAVAAGAERVVAMGHSFGGAVAVRAAVIYPHVVSGVVTFATQSGGCEVAGGLAGRPLLMFHGERDQILPVETSEIVRALAGDGELIVLPGDDHLLARSDAIMCERLAEWLPVVLDL
jgi:hypothetical protein